MPSAPCLTPSPSDFFFFSLVTASWSSASSSLSSVLPSGASSENSHTSMVSVTEVEEEEALSSSSSSGSGSGGSSSSSSGSTTKQASRRRRKTSSQRGVRGVRRTTSDGKAAGSKATRRRQARAVLFCFLVLAVVVFELAALALSSMFVILRVATVPSTDGTLALAGLEGPVRIEREADGMVHIIAGSAHDAAFAQGVVAIQDRMWQLEHLRLGARGKTSSVLGAGSLERDAIVHGLDLPGVAAAEWAWLTAGGGSGNFTDLSRVANLTVDAGDAALMVSTVEAYTAGINAYLNVTSTRALEFVVHALGWPEPWSPVDVLAVGRYLAWVFQARSQFEADLARLRLDGSEASGDYDLDRLFPAFGSGDAARRSRVRSGRRLMQTSFGDQAAEQAAGEGLGVPVTGTGGASTVWALAAGQTASGWPLLAAQYEAPASGPSPWQSIHIRVEYGVAAGNANETRTDSDAVGLALVGVPGIFAGQNADVAWAPSMLHPDTVDLYEVEETNLGSAYSYQDTVVPYTTANASFVVDGLDAFSVTYRRAAIGPVISDLVEVGTVGQQRGIVAHWLGRTAPNLLVASLAKVSTARSAVAAAVALRSPPSLLPLDVAVAERSAGGAVDLVRVGAVPVDFEAQRFEAVSSDDVRRADSNSERAVTASPDSPAVSDEAGVGSARRAFAPPGSGANYDGVVAEILAGITNATAAEAVQLLLRSHGSALWELWVSDRLDQLGDVGGTGAEWKSKLEAWAEGEEAAEDDGTAAAFLTVWFAHARDAGGVALEAWTSPDVVDSLVGGDAAVCAAAALPASTCPDLATSTFTAAAASAGPVSSFGADDAVESAFSNAALGSTFFGFLVKRVVEWTGGPFALGGGSCAFNEAGDGIVAAADRLPSAEVVLGGAPGTAAVGAVYPGHHGSIFLAAHDSSLQHWNAETLPGLAVANYTAAAVQTLVFLSNNLP